MAHHLASTRSLAGPTNAPITKPNEPASKLNSGTAKGASGQIKGDAPYRKTNPKSARLIAAIADQKNARRWRSEPPRIQNQKARAATVIKNAKRLPDSSHGS